MEALDDVNEMLAYYNKSKPDIALSKKAYAILGRFPKEARAKAIDWLYEHKERKFGVDVISFREALRETGTSVSEYVPAEDWTCDACGLTFKFFDQPTEEDKLEKGIFDFCPRCGFQPCWTREVEAHRKSNGLPFGWEPEWYTERKEQCEYDHRAPKSPHYSAAEARRENKMNRTEIRAQTQAYITKLAQAKRA